MGSFNVSCVLSNLSIRHGDPCYYIPLIADKWSNGVIPRDSGICSNEGSQALFQPVFLSIFGKYDDYGSIEDIAKNSNTEAIERILGVSIHNFMDKPTNFEIPVSSLSVEKSGIEKVVKEQPLYGCFVHKFAYDIAFKYVTKNKKRFYYRDVPKGKNIFDETIDKMREIYEQEETLEKEIKECEKGAESKDVLNAVKRVSALLKFARVSPMTDSSHFQFLAQYKDEIKANDPCIRKLMNEMYCLIQFMFANCRLFMPTVQGPQEGDIDSENALLKGSVKYLEMKEEEYDRMNEEDYDRN